MYIAEFAQTLEPLDISASRYVEECLLTAADLGRPAAADVPCRSRNVIVQGLRLHLLDWGESGDARPELLLLHGGVVTARTWGPFCAMLAHRYRLLALDMRGHGDSEWPADGEASHNTMAEDLRGVIQALGLEQPIVVGHSVGGMVAMRVMVSDPELLRAAVLVDVGPQTAYQGWTPKAEVTESHRLYEQPEDYVTRNAPRLKRSEQHMRRNAHHEFMQRADGLYQLKYDPRHPMGGPDEHTMPGLPDLDAMSRVTVPTLVTRGERSWFFSQEAAQRLAATVPRAELAVIPDCEHMVYIENPAGLAAMVETFVGAGEF